MAGKFTNTQYGDTINKLVSTISDKANNPYYKFSDKKPTTVTYYKQNKEKTTLDEASKLNYQHVGELSPIKFNKINNFILYDIGRITLDFDVTDYGLESSPINGNAIVLPNTIEPTDGDFFLINQIKEDGLLFKVDKVTPDTLDTGANLYQIEYHLELTKAKNEIEKQVVKIYNFTASNIGTDFKTLFTEEESILMEQYEALIEELIRYYSALFFDEKLQTFVFSFNNHRMYDPYMIEFIINNKLFIFSNEYIYVAHATALDTLFPLQYSKTIFYQLENIDHKIDFDSYVTADKIIDPNSLFVTRLEDYYQIKYRDPVTFKTRFNILHNSFNEAIRNKKYLENSNCNEVKIFNFIISYFKNEVDEYIGDIFDILKHMDWVQNEIAFYCIPIIIFILQKYIRYLMS